MADYVQKSGQKLSTEPYKGVRDFYPEDQAFLNYFIDTCRGVVEKVGYEEYHASILEPVELYKGKGAENEEIIREQVYTFTDRGEREVALRPEMTPTVARMVAARRRELAFPLRWYSIPNVFRYERPQRGRLREHWQLNVDLFGSRSLYADAEIIGVAYGLMAAFGATESDFVIKLNSRAALDELCASLKLDDTKKKVLMGLLDKMGKVPTDEFAANLRGLGLTPAQVLPARPPKEIAQLIEEFKNAGISNIVYAPEVVRGFNYYTGVVFEVFDTHKDNSRALFGGGRYDNLTALFDEDPIPGVGFGLGDVGIHNFLESRGLLPSYTPPAKVYIAIPEPRLAPHAQTLAGLLREGGVNAAIDFGERKLGDQIKNASKHKIPYLIVVGEKELAEGRFVVRDLGSGEEQALDKGQLAEFFLNI